MAQDSPVKLPAGYAPAFTIGFSDAGGNIVLAAADAPLPVSLSAPAAPSSPAPLSGTLRHQDSRQQIAARDRFYSPTSAVTAEAKCRASPRSLASRAATDIRPCSASSLASAAIAATICAGEWGSMM